MSRRIGVVVLVVAVVFAGQQNMPGVVIVIIPLCPVFSSRRIRFRVEQACTIIIVFQHEMNHAAGLSGKAADRRADLKQDRRLSRLDDRMDCVEPQTVEAIMLDPMQRILDREGADLLDPIINRAAPRGVSSREEGRRVNAKIISFRAKVIVDDVKEDHQPARVRCIDQRF